MNEKITLLYVDDDPINLMVFEINFDKNYTVITAESGEQGLIELSKNPKIQLVISDMSMPEMNGIEFIRKAKQEYASIKYFILTGYEITEEITNALEEKLINRYFQKPFDQKEIDSAVKEAIGQ